MHNYTLKWAEILSLPYNVLLGKQTYGLDNYRNGDFSFLQSSVRKTTCGYIKHIPISSAEAMSAFW